MNESKNPTPVIQGLRSESNLNDGHSDSIHHGDYSDSGMSINSAQEVAFNNTIDSLKPSTMVFLLALLTSISGFMFGYDTGYISGAMVVVGEDLGHALSSGEKELITAATSLGALITAISGGMLADVLGRKWVITVANIMFIVGGAIQTGAHTVWTMIIGRFIMGFGVGWASLVAPMYLSEVAPTRFRGRVVILYVLAITLGQLVAYAIGYGLSTTHNGWRILVGLSMIPSVFQMVLFVFMPETPRYSVLRGWQDQAGNALMRIYNGASQDQINQKLLEIANDIPAAAMELHTSKRETFGAKISSSLHIYRRALKALFSKASNRRALSIVVALQLFQQFSGWNALMYYSGTIFQSVGFSNPTAVSIIIAGTNFVFTILAFLIIDKIGRRALLVSTMWGMSVGLIMCAVSFHYLPFDANGGLSDSTSFSNKWSIIVIVFIFFYAASYATGIGNVPWQQSELLPMEVRGVGSSFATATNWAGSLVVSSTFLTMLNNITPTGTFAFYAGICAVGEVMVFVFYPETARLSIEEVHHLLEGGYRVAESVRLSKQKRQLFNHREI